MVFGILDDVCVKFGEDGPLFQKLKSDTHPPPPTSCGRIKI
jgi:hypothetical protein